MQSKILLSPGLWRSYSLLVTTKKGFLAFRVSPDLKREIQEIADSEARSISQVCELLLIEGIQEYRKEGPKFMQRLISKQKVKVKGR
jgi:hypothetical protein